MTVARVGVPRSAAGQSPHVPRADDRQPRRDAIRHTVTSSRHNAERSLTIHSRSRTYPDRVTRHPVRETHFQRRQHHGAARRCDWDRVVGRVRRSRNANGERDHLDPGSVISIRGVIPGRLGGQHAPSDRTCRRGVGRRLNADDAPVPRDIKRVDGLSPRCRTTIRSRPSTRYLSCRSTCRLRDVACEM